MHDPTPRPAVLRACLLALLGLVVLGWSLRVAQFAAGESMWGDEIKLAESIVDRDAVTLVTRPLAHRQVAPSGYLLLSRAAVVLAGTGDRALRLVPFVASLLTVALGALVAWHLLPGPGALVATGILALAPRAVHLGAVTKPYASDMAAAVLLIGLMLALVDARRSRSKLLLALGAGLLTFVSVPAALVVGAVVFALALPKPREAWPALLLLALATAGGAAVLAHTSDPAHAYMRFFWADGFAPPFRDYPTWSFDRLTDLLPPLMFLPYAASGAWNQALSTVPGLGVALLIGVIAGCGVLATRDGRAALVVGGTLLAAVTASYWTLYPLDTRVSAYLLPMVALALGAAAAPLLEGLTRRRPATAVIAALVTLLPWTWTLVREPPPYRTAPMREVVSWVSERASSGDVVFAHWGVQSGVRHYGRTHPLPRVVWGSCLRGDNRAALVELDTLRGEARAWVVFGKVFPRLEDRAVMLDYLRAIGHELADTTFASRRGDEPASAHLFDLSDPERLARSTAATHPVRAGAAVPRNLACSQSSPPEA